MTEGRPPWRPWDRARGQPSGGAFADQVAFELTLGELGDGVDRVAQGAAEPIQPPHDQGVAGPQLVQDLLEVGRSGRAPLAVSVNTR